MNAPLKIVQCWDDGITADIRLTEILRKHNASATFNLNAGLHTANRQFGWMHKGTTVDHLGLHELRDVYEGFVIANHGLMHPYLDKLPFEEAAQDVSIGRKRLQDIFDQTILGFAYPFGTYNSSAMKAVEQAGHSYARTIGTTNTVFPPKNPFELHPSCHFQDVNFWKFFEEAKITGVFYFWGHSYEMISEPMWVDFESTIQKFSSDASVRWCNVEDLFLTPNSLVT